MSKRISLIAAGILLLPSELSFSQDLQAWEIDILDQDGGVHTTANMQCDRTACDAKSWTVLSQETGCLYQLDFSVQFSGSSVRLMLFHESFASNCANMRLLVATGTGFTDKAYPDATRASGEVTLGFEAGGINSSGTTRWQARRVTD